MDKTTNFISDIANLFKNKILICTKRKNKISQTTYMVFIVSVCYFQIPTFCSNPHLHKTKMEQHKNFVALVHIKNLEIYTYIYIK